MTYNCTLPKVIETVKKHWKVLQINNEFKDAFPELPMMCFRRNKNLKDFFGTKAIVNNKAQKVKLSPYHLIPCQKPETYVVNK